jgi:hypothetical protein
MVTTGAIPITSIDKNRDVALSKVNVKGLINEGNTPAKKTWVRPASGTFSTVADIEGLLMAGTPADIARDTKRYEEAGLNHIVFDLPWASCRVPADRLLGQEVRRARGRSRIAFKSFVGYPDPATTGNWLNAP